MHNIISDSVREWSRRPGLPAVNVFEGVRDIPFAVIPEQYSLEKGPASMLVEKRGFCVPKHYLLGMIFEKIGMRVRYPVYDFKWHDLHLPHGLKERAFALPVTFHLACKIFVGEQWVLVDATWDALLEKAGFPVNLGWDGGTDTLNAVKPLAECSCDTALAAGALIHEKVVSYSLPEKLALARFSADLNKWLEEVRGR
jgi:hypothetical protein